MVYAVVFRMGPSKLEDNWAVAKRCVGNRSPSGEEDEDEYVSRLPDERQRQ